MKPGRALLFNEDAETDQNSALGLDDVIEKAEAAYDAAEAAAPEGEEPSEVEVDLTDTPDEGEETPAEETPEEVPGEETPGEETPAEETPEEEETPAEETPEEANLRYANQVEAERAQQEARDAMNKANWERDQALAQLRAAQEYQQSHAQTASATTPDSAALLTLAQSDPIDAFNQALDAGDNSVVGKIMAAVNVDSQQFAAKAAMAAEEGDHESAQTWQQRAVNAATLHRDMQRADWQAASQAQAAEQEAAMAAQLEPIQQERMTQALSHAATKVMSSEFFEGIATTEHDERIGQYIQQYPQVMGDWSPAAMEAGFLVAAQQVIFGSQAKMIEHMVNRKLEAAKGEAPVAKPKARGTGGGAGRKVAAAPAAGSAQAQADEIRQSVGTGSKPSGMGLLFGG